MVVLCLMLLNIWRAGGQWTRGLTSLLQMTEAEPRADDHTMILQQITGVSELTTAVLAMESVVPTSSDRMLGSYVIGTTRLLYIAHGEVSAGIDLSQLEEDDIRITGDTLQVQLPPPMILDSKIDVQRSRVYDYDRGFLGLGPDAAPELQALAQRETLAELVKVACERQLLEQANERATTVLSQLLNSTGDYQSVLINTQTPDPGACQLSSS